eukprot:c21675_g1_i1 orf=375-3545(-)
MDDAAASGAKRSPFAEQVFNNNKKRGRVYEMGEKPMSAANLSVASFCQLEESNLLDAAASLWHCRPDVHAPFCSSRLQSGSWEWDAELDQSSLSTEQYPNSQQYLHALDDYNASPHDVQRVHNFFKHSYVSYAAVPEGNLTLTSGWPVSSQLQNNGNDPMDADHSDGESSGDCDGSGNKNGLKGGMERDMATMDLTDDLLHLVFSFLDQKRLCISAMVCRQWRIASAHEDFWKSLSFEGGNVTEEKVGWLCCKYSKAEELTLKEVPSIDEVAREAMLSLQGLRSLHLHKGILTESFFTALASGCFALQQLSITDTILGSGGSQEVSVHHENLQQLKIIRCRVMRIAIRCPSLDSLSLKQTSMALAVLKCQKLRSLNLSSCHKLSDAVVRAAAIACTALLELDISQCSYVSDETLRDISIACGNLSILDVSHCPNISLEGVSLPMLKKLRLHNCEGINSTSMTALSQCFTLESVLLDLCALLTSVFLDLERLDSISLDNCRKFVDLTLMCPALMNISIAACPALKRINISSLALTKLVLQKQVSLTTIALQCPRLCTVDLSECDSLSNSICKVFSDGGGCPRLTSLNLDSCESLTAVNLSSTSLEFLSLAGCCHMYSLELACAKLQCLNLDGCDHLTLATFAPVGLQSLNLGICPRVTDLKIEALYMTSLDLKGCGALSQADIYCPQLLSLDAFYCSRLEDNCLEATTTFCPLIQSLILASCPSIGPAGLSSLRKLLNLTVLDLSYTFLTYLSPVFENCPRLKTLRLLACKYLVDTALDSLHGKKNLPELRELDLSYGTLGQTALEGLLSQCTHLTHVNINGCVNLHDLDWESKPPPPKSSMAHEKTNLISVEGSRHLQSKGGREDGEEHYGDPDGPNHRSHIIGKLGNPPANESTWNIHQNCEFNTFQERMVHEDDPIFAHALQFLNCVGCPNIKKVVITHSTGFLNLLSLNLSLGSNITEVRLECLQLASLNLSNCTALEVLDIKCPRLVSLWLQGSNIEESVLEAVLQGCSALETLDVRNCSKLTYETLVLVRAVCPRLRRLLNSTSANNSMGF